MLPAEKGVAASKLRPAARDGSEARVIDRQSDQATSLLRSLIINMELEPGSTLDEASILKRLGCGRTPLREALMRLAEERLVVIVPRRSISISPISIVDLRQIVEVRLPMEVRSASLAAQRIDQKQIEELEEYVAALGTAGGLKSRDIVHLDYNFHYRLARISGNPYLADNLRRLLGPAMRLTLCADIRGVPVAPMRTEHACILEAIKAHDADEAASRMRAHILSAKDRIVEAL